MKLYKNDKYNIVITEQYYKHLQDGHTYEDKTRNILLTYRQFNEVKNGK